MRNSNNSAFPSSLCTLAGEESCPDDPKEEVLSATRHHNRGLAQYPPATYVCEPAEFERGEPLSVSDESGWNLQRARLLTLSSPQGESSAEQGAIVSALEFESGLSTSFTTGTQCETGAGKDHDGHTPAMESSVTDPAPGISPRKFSWASDEDCESLAAAQAGELR